MDSQAAIAIFPTSADTVESGSVSSPAPRRLGRCTGRERNVELSYATRDAALRILREGIAPFAVQPVVGKGFGPGHAWVEALIRPQVDGTPVSPLSLYAYAEGAGLGSALDAVMVDSVARWMAMTPTAARVAINLTGTYLSDPRGLAHDVLATLDAHGVNPQRCMFEVSELAPITDLAAARDTLALLRAAGAHIALDDLGGGQSHLRLATGGLVDVLKVDRNLWWEGCHGAVRGRDEQDLRVLRGLAAMASAMDAELVIEGIQDEDEIEIARSLGEHVYIQGYATGRPVPVTASGNSTYYKPATACASPGPTLQSLGRTRAWG